MSLRQFHFNSSLELRNISFLTPRAINGNKEGTPILLTISATSKHELRNVVLRTITVLANNSQLTLDNSWILVEDSNDKKQPILMSYRVAFVGSTLQEICVQMQTMKWPKPSKNFLCSEHPKFAFLFTGQGSQYKDMGKGLYESSEIFRAAFDNAANILQEEYGIQVKDCIYSENLNEELNMNINSSIYSQTSVFCIGYALASLWKSFGVNPDIVLGPSAGGFCAAAISGNVSLQKAAFMVGGRAKLINALPSGGMTCVKAELENVKQLIGQMSDWYWLDVAVINSEHDIVVAGRPAALDQFEQLCFENGFKTTRLAASQAFHSREIENIREDYEHLLNRVKTEVNNSKSSVSYVSGIDGKLMKNETEFSPSYWIHHARDPVDLPAAVNSLWNSGARIFIEIGAKPVLINDAVTILGDDLATKALWLPSIRASEDNWITIFKALAKIYEAGCNINCMV